jgi:hypothetical protein
MTKYVDAKDVHALIDEIQKEVDYSSDLLDGTREEIIINPDIRMINKIALAELDLKKIFLSKLKGLLDE